MGASVNGKPRVSKTRTVGSIPTAPAGVVASTYPSINGIIIGFGTMGQTHASRYRKLGVTIVGVVDTDPTSRALAEKLGLHPCNTLAEAMIASFDFIDICTPTHLHYEQIREVMTYQSPICVEKPIVRTRDEVRALRALFYPHPIFVAEVEQYNPAFIPFFEYAGRPQRLELSREVNLEFFLHGQRPWFLDERLSGGIVLDCMIHDINMVVGKFGRPVVKRARGERARYDSTDSVEAVLGFDGFDATLSCSWTATRTDTPIVATMTITERDGNRLVLRCDDYLLGQKPAGEDAYYLELKAFLESVATGRFPHSLCEYLDGIEVALEIVDAMRDSGNRSPVENGV